VLNFVGGSFSENFKLQEVVLQICGAKKDIIVLIMFSNFRV
jgi:hypothetical protein